ncbi:N-acetylglutamate synthase-like GNAT family acetyltransferase [Motilibacter rhizosphaerae]|uniref:N-acetylglutamate synthase-like GNAT family acetyltransferase n=1 Tax=Motilibacter rhizosphaerae TaxID=598652 RepID=A0A4Q7NG37_9ACTN|nr:GNAT family N-acetyltransferase [Motilibacter rhizosphaerae]RZS82861.1 N-acetylglutamate synthase-like GNAT family acetyltransferase [Motilibacter rhizosphaerae]
MPRGNVQVRKARREDAPGLLLLWSELRDLTRTMDRVAPVPTERGVHERLDAAEADPDLRILVAELDGEIAGMAVLTHQPYAVLFDARSVHLHFMHVRQSHRRRGVGHALVAAATAFAEEVGADQIMTSTLPQTRDENRFFARLGFAPVVIRRSATVATVRRRLAADAGAVSAVEDLLARRRSMRSRSRLRLARAAE